MRFYKIREPKINEIVECIRVLYLSFDRPIFKDNKEEEKFWTHLIKINIAKFLIAVKNEKIFGIGGLFLFKQVGSIGYMGVLPKYRGNGVGTEILKKLMEKAINLGCKTVVLYASKLGEPIYRKFGFYGSYSAKTYILPKKIPKLFIHKKDVKLINSLQGWLLKLDAETIGFDRSEYLRARVNLGAKTIVIESEGYAFLSKVRSNVRLGPLVATNVDAALQIVRKGISLGANNIILPKHPFYKNKFSSLIKLKEQEDNINLKMNYGQKVTEKLDYLYTIGSYAKG
jgi:ribosomal-protein-alanine N-acetyltransferase